MPIPADILRSVRDLKPLSQSAARLLQLMGQPDHDFAQIIRVVEHDAVLTAKILRIVNSAAFALRSPVSSVSRAVPFLGTQTIVGIALETCSAHVFNDALTGYESERGALWRHSLRTALAAREIASFTTDSISPDEAFTAGILHDIGKSVISSYLQGQAHELLQATDIGQVKDYLEAERGQLGTDHCEVGAELGAQWNLPASLCEAIRWHHVPSQSDKTYRSLVYGVHLGDFLAMMAGVGTGTDTLVYQLDEHYQEVVPLEARELEVVSLVTEVEFEKAVELIFTNKG